MFLFPSRKHRVHTFLRLIAAEPVSAKTFRGRIPNAPVLSGISLFLLPKHEAIADAPAFWRRTFRALLIPYNLRPTRNLEASQP